MSDVDALAYVMAGGAGTRLFPLTRDRAKPGVPFAGNYRVIDFPLSNVLNSNIRKTIILTQYESFSTKNHISHGFLRRVGFGRDQYLEIQPAMKGTDKGWYEGTADSINQNIRFMKEDMPDVVDILGGDHVYLMDYRLKNNFHLNNNADLTISAIPVKKELAANNYGVLVVDKNWQLKGWEEKPSNPTSMPGNEEYCLASMGNYAFNPESLLEELANDKLKEQTDDKKKMEKHPDKYTMHDFGFNIIPSMLNSGKKIFVYNFNDNMVPGAKESERGYWKDIGNIDQYFAANMEMRYAEPPINLYNPKWDIFTHIESFEPFKTINTKYHTAKTENSIISNGVINSGGQIQNSIVSYNVKIEKGAFIENSIILGHGTIGQDSHIKNSIIDRKNNIPDKELIGVDPVKDKERGFTVSEGGVTVVPRNYF
ncbi:MAG: sugar phosphate nucleotidyltransferase [archaeon]